MHYQYLKQNTASVSIYVKAFDWAWSLRVKQTLFET